GQCGLPHARHVLDEEMATGEEADYGEPDHLGLADQCAADVLLEPADQVEGIGHGLPLYTGRSRDRRDRGGNKLRMVWPGPPIWQPPSQPPPAPVATRGWGARGKRGAIRAARATTAAQKSDNRRHCVCHSRAVPRDSP